jgi:maltooligosyltrehalose trehalohydrolase
MDAAQPAAATRETGPTVPLPPLGASVAAGATTFRVWATKPRRLDLRLAARGRTLAMQPDPASAGLWSLTVPDVGAGARYGYLLDGAGPYPDPCSRWQPEGVHGPSAVVDAAAFAWDDEDWTGLTADGLAIYELHTGAFTPAGTFDAAIEKLDGLAQLGVTAIEIMPVADFPGARNWGYDGVALYAASRAYGGPDGLWRLVNAAHARGLGVILDCVYNHLGPDGNYLRLFSEEYFTDRYQTPWGDALNYDGAGSRAVREYVLQNVGWWLRDCHIDGLRLDATDTIKDASTPHLLREIAERARAAARGRGVVVIAESAANDVRLIQPVRAGGDGLDGVWADDFHHTVHTALTGENEGYYAGYDGSPAAIAATVAGGFLYHGQLWPPTGRSRGTRVSDEPGDAFIFCLQNHDQVGNRALGERLDALASPAAVRAATALLLFAPETPLLFMGQEFAASTPFLFFTDHNPELGKLVTEGRRNEFGAFSHFRDPELRARIPDPQDEATFLRSKLNWSERDSHAGTLRLYRALLALRRDDPVLARSGRSETQTAVCGEKAIAVLRRWGDEARLLICNLGDGEARIEPSQPLLAQMDISNLRLVLWTNDAPFGQDAAPSTPPEALALSGPGSAIWAVT